VPEIVILDEDGHEEDYIPLDTEQVKMEEYDDVAVAQSIMDEYVSPGYECNLQNAIDIELGEYLKGKE